MDTSGHARTAARATKLTAWNEVRSAVRRFSADPNPEQRDLVVQAFNRLKAANLNSDLSRQTREDAA